MAAAKKQQSAVDTSVVHVSQRNQNCFSGGLSRRENLLCVNVMAAELVLSFQSTELFSEFLYEWEPL